ncbi:MAG: ribonuclease HII [candidate division KSB1 bacterium]|nr:ribonuclease HII [candidate division KSB1 bacterium]MDZ7319253.1 ribonuclease HII [candidate division KSB1 bacterium]
MKKVRTKHKFSSPTLHYEQNLWAAGVQQIAGVDEAGRGPLAGPVVAAAVIFAPGVYIVGVNDSKKLSPDQREVFFQRITARALAIGVGIVGEKMIDRINILQATYRAMRQAIAQLNPQPEHVLVDGRPIPDLNLPQMAIVGGDGKCFSIAAASIIAKVTRDRLMLEYDRLFPQYGFAQHKGYPTKKHIQAIIKYGYCPIHRTTFNIKNLEAYATANNKER